jgi:hypothetical protein
MSNVGDIVIGEDMQVQVVIDDGIMPITSAITTPSMNYDNMDSITISSSGISYGAISMNLITEDILDRYSFNKFTIDHKVQEHELMKLKETVPTYADEIKENLAKNMSRDIMKKMTFTKRHDKDADVHHFLGRVWVFTEEELKNLIEEVKNA